MGDTLNGLHAAARDGVKSEVAAALMSFRAAADVVRRSEATPERAEPAKGSPVALFAGLRQQFAPTSGPEETLFKPFRAVAPDASGP